MVGAVVRAAEPVGFDAALWARACGLDVGALAVPAEGGGLLEAQFERREWLCCALFCPAQFPRRSSCRSRCAPISPSPRWFRL